MCRGGGVVSLLPGVALKIGVVRVGFVYNEGVVALEKTKKERKRERGKEGKRERKHEREKKREYTRTKVKIARKMTQKDELQRIYTTYVDFAMIIDSCTDV